MLKSNKSVITFPHSVNIYSLTFQQLIELNEKIEILYKDETIKFSKKETQSSLTETLSNLGVDKTKLALTSIEIKDDKSIGYILGSILPFIFPIILFFLIIWFLSRGMKGAGGQAFSFGSSKATSLESYLLEDSCQWSNCLSCAR
jgi:ATP-dependent Zn protease